MIATILRFLGYVRIPVEPHESQYGGYDPRGRWVRNG